MATFAALLPRLEPSFGADERTMLLTWLAYHRSTLAMKCDGLTEAQLKQRPIATSTLSLLGLVRHVSDVERYWIREIVLGHHSVARYYSDEHPDGEFDLLDAHDVSEVIADWIQEAQHTNEAIAGVASLDERCEGVVGHHHGNAEADHEPHDATHALGHATPALAADEPAQDLEAVRTWEDEGGSVRPDVPSVRWVLTHLIEEFARHNGHADLIRELIDGSTGE